MLQIIWIALILIALLYGGIFFRDVFKNRFNLENCSWTKVSIIGFVVNFFDALGIGAFAPQTALLKFTKQTKDRYIPGTMNVANTIPVLLEAIIFIKVIQVEPLTLIAMLASAAVGAIIGAGIVSKLPERTIQLTMGAALIVTAFLMFAGKMNWMPSGGVAIGITGTKLVIAIVVNFILGALMTVGVGLFAPCMALVYFLGMSPKVAFPIMMGSCAFLMPPASAKFIKEKAYNKKAAAGMAIFGSIGVLIASFIVKELPIDLLGWLVIVVVLYTAVSMLISAAKNKNVETTKKVVTE